MISLRVTIRVVGPTVSLLLRDGTLLLVLERLRSSGWLLGGSCSRSSVYFGGWGCVCTGRDECYEVEVWCSHRLGLFMSIFRRDSNVFTPHVACEYEDVSDKILEYLIDLIYDVLLPCNTFGFNIQRFSKLK
jgi:hypothetical protein